MRFVYSIYLFIYLINAIISYILIVPIGMSLVVINFTSVVKQSQKKMKRSFKNEPRHEKTNEMTFAPREDSDQPDRSSLCTQWVTKESRLLPRTAKTLIRLGGCPN